MDYVELNLSEAESVFVDKLTSLLHESGCDPEYLFINRLSDKTLNFRLTGCQIGRVKLQGRKTGMQVLTRNTVRWYEDEALEKYLSRLPRWLAYVKSSNLLYDPARPTYKL